MSKTQKTLLFGLAGVVLLVFLMANVGASQFAYAPLMFRVVGLQDADAAREFLVDMEGQAALSSVYAGQSEYLNSHFDNIFAREVDVERLNGEKAIGYYEGLLALNEGNPQVLIKLSLLYSERGDKGRATEYMKRAQEIDPWVEVE
jgi:tetratricopeptide (TPR) repeat protein